MPKIAMSMKRMTMSLTTMTTMPILLQCLNSSYDDEDDYRDDHDEDCSDDDNNNIFAVTD